MWSPARCGDGNYTFQYEQSVPCIHLPRNTIMLIVLKLATNCVLLFAPEENETTNQMIVAHIVPEVNLTFSGIRVNTIKVLSSFDILSFMTILMYFVFGMF